ncbi:MAG: hypothetical protein IJZ64_07570 [Ruminococcus sp.]|nr:hypothetical protein [Ruminococcus sp.]
MVYEMMIAAILILTVILIVEIVQVFTKNHNKTNEKPEGLYTILPYYQSNKNFEKRLHEVISQMRWMDSELLRCVYIVGIDIDKEHENNIKKICNKHGSLIYCTKSEFEKFLDIKDFSSKSDCILSKKIV